MALTLRLDLSSASVADLEALLSAARAGGAVSSSRVSVDGTYLVVDAETPAVSAPVAPAQQAGASSGASDAADTRANSSTSDGADSAAGADAASSKSGPQLRPQDLVGPVGDAAIRTVFDLISGRQNPQSK